MFLCGISLLLKAASVFDEEVNEGSGEASLNNEGGLGVFGRVEIGDHLRDACDLLGGFSP